MQTHRVYKCRGVLGNAVKNGLPPEKIDDARRDLHAAVLERAIGVALAAAPPLTDGQRTALAEILVPGRVTA